MLIKYTVLMSLMWSKFVSISYYNMCHILIHDLIYVFNIYDAIKILAANFNNVIKIYVVNFL